MRSVIRASVFASFLFLGWAAAAVAQVADVEPNDTCEMPQDLGSASLPLVVDGNLSPVADIDFFALTGTPGEVLLIRHEGQPTGNGTLGDPFLGVFSTACELIAFNDDSGSLNSRLVLAVPTNGQIIIAATAFPDADFVGIGEGTYRLTVEVFQTIGTISGRLVDAVSGAPLPGEVDPFASALLVRCDEFGCFDFVNSQVVNAGGEFFFASDFADNPLGEGTYQVQGFSNRHETFFSEPFAVMAGDSIDLGDLGLEPFRFVGSVSGRLVDAVDGAPLPGDRPPFSFVSIERCDQNGCIAEGFATPDGEGRFRVDGLEGFLRAGTYQLSAFADQFQQAVSARFPIAEGEDFDFGDLALEPFPLQFSALEPCTIPPRGGTCLYQLVVRNSTSERFFGETWHQVSASGIGSPAGFSTFQVGREGTVNPKPEVLNLRPGETTVLKFAFDVPATVADGAFFCLSAFLGQDPNPLFNVLGERFLFCVEKTGGEFLSVPEKVGRKQLRQMRKQRVR